MRKFFIFVFCFFILSFSVFASGDLVETDPVSTDPVVTDPASSDSISDEVVIRNVSPVTPNDANGLKKVLLELFGDYEMVVSEHRYTNTNGYTSISVSTEPDYAWLCSAGIFIIVLYCSLRILGGVICGKH